MHHKEMYHHLSQFVLGTLLVLCVGIIARTGFVNVVENTNNIIAGAFGKTLKIEDLHETYQDKKDTLKILIVPGHDIYSTGAQFGALTEESINRELGKYLYGYFKKDKKFEVVTARDFENGLYTDELQEYFSSEREKILSFMTERRRNMAKVVMEGKATRNALDNHTFADSETSIRLYGINKWANENDVDVMIHIHFNDAGGRKYGEKGEYRGFAVYIPEGQFPNSEASRDIAESIYEQLSELMPPSNLYLEAEGIIESQDLIALGSNASQKGASFLIEYGYIYEDQFIYEHVRNDVFKELAYQTYISIKEYFDEEALEDIKYQTALLPYDFAKDHMKKRDRDAGVLALHVALRKEGMYPPLGFSLYECPISGYFGDCTEKAVKSFQEVYAKDILKPHNLVSGTGVLEKATQAKLQELYGR